MKIKIDIDIKSENFVKENFNANEIAEERRKRSIEELMKLINNISQN